MTVTLQDKMEARSAKEEVMQAIREEAVEFIRMQFTDLHGMLKSVTVSAEEMEKVWEGKLMFDGSSVDGFSDVEQSDLYLVPDPDTFSVVPWQEDDDTAFMTCDVYNTEGQPFEGSSRGILKRVLKEAHDLGYEFQVGVEGEYFLFPVDADGKPVFQMQDSAGYFDPAPADAGEEIRRDILLRMKRLGFVIEAAHHEVAPGQHEVDFRFDRALMTADRWMTFKQIVKAAAGRRGMFASFLPKPKAGQNGNAMHCNQSLWSLDGRNVFYDAESPDGLSSTAKSYIAGLMKYAREIAAVCNPTVNSYKRLLPGYEAPTNIAWSGSNRSALIRIPHSRGNGTRIELRNPDPTANIYLVFAMMLKAGLRGVQEGLEPPKEMKGNIFAMTGQEREAAGIDSYPRDLWEAIEELEAGSLAREVMGEPAFEAFLRSKKEEWRSFAETVHPWEMEQYWMKY